MKLFPSIKTAMRIKRTLFMYTRKKFRISIYRSEGARDLKQSRKKKVIETSVIGQCGHFAKHPKQEEEKKSPSFFS